MTQETPPSVSAAKLALAAKRFRDETQNADLVSSEPVAIVGIGCRFPGNVRSTDDYWSLLRNRVDAITKVPADRWDADSYFDEHPLSNGKINSKYGGFLSNPELFDPVFFDIAPREAFSIDPQQRLLLEITWEAIGDAGWTPESLNNTKTGVFVGICSSDYARLLFTNPDDIGPHSCSGAYHSVGSGRLSYLLNLRGPSISIDTACSSSLVAVHLACQSLRSRECNVALAGGVNLHLQPEHHVGLTKLGMLAPDGRCKTFDSRANGFVPGEGCGVVVLKRLADALGDRDRVWAVIRGTAVNQDGRTNVLTAPNGLAQQDVIHAAIQNARISPSSISYVETHGTGTALGDPIEVEALTAVLSSHSPTSTPCALGAVKTNIGHLEAAAGIAGLIKATLALEHEEIPPNLHFEALNPHISLSGTRLYIPTTSHAWPRGKDIRFAGVSSFGFSGTNAHIVLEEAPRLPLREENPASSSSRFSLLPISARTPEALRDFAASYRAFLTGTGKELPIQQICRTASVRRSHYEERLAVTAESREDFCRLLNDFLAGHSRHNVAKGRASLDPGGVVFVCSGQGSQWALMGTSLLNNEPVFRAALVECEDLIRQAAGWSLLELLSTPSDDSKLGHTEYAQPAIFALEVALSRLWQSWGITPAAVIGHSAGEVAAAHIAGVLTLKEAVRVVVKRGQLMEAATGLGRMAAVQLSALEVTKELRFSGQEISIGAINGPNSTVISGEGLAVERLLQTWRDRKIACRLLPVDYAFHSAQMQAFSEQLVHDLGVVAANGQKTPIISTVFGRLATGSEFDAAYWGRNIRRPVLFEAAVDASKSMGLKAFLEIGPHPVLLNSIGECFEGETPNPDLIASLRRNQDERGSLLSSLGTLYSMGQPVNWGAVYSGQAPAVSLPHYPYQKQRYWVDRKPASQKNILHPLLGTRLRSPALRGIVFESHISIASLPYLADHRIAGTVLFPMSAFLETAQRAALEAYGKARALTDVLVLAPFAITSDTVSTIQVAIEDDRFRIFSLAGESWTEHASGRFSDLEGQPADQLVTSDRFHFEDAATHYAGLRAQGCDFGESFQTVRRIARHPREAAAYISLQGRETPSARQYLSHPAILDGCLQTAIAAAGGDLDGVFLPFGIDRFDVFQPFGADILAYTRLRPPTDSGTLTADIDVRDQQGSVLAHIAGLHLRRTATTVQQSKIYEVKWREGPRGTPVEQARNGWLIVSDEGEIRAQVVTAFRERGHQVEVCGFEEVLDRCRSGLDIVFVASSELKEGVEGAVSAATDNALSLVQRLLKSSPSTPCPLWLVTRGAVTVEPQDRCECFFQTALWGLLRTTALEHPELRCARVDLDPDDTNFDSLAQEITLWDGEPEVAFREGTRYIPRLQSTISFDRQPQRWSIVNRGSIDDLALAPLTRRTPAHGEVEVEVETSALNFRDVLSVLGMYPGEPGPLGLEFCGRITKIGPGVAGHNPGDRVMGVAWGSFASFVTTAADTLIRVPRGIAPPEAVGLPNAFLTAYHCLVHLGQIKRGQRVLIHAASGGVGLAAVQLAQQAGAEIFATAGSENKRTYLQSIGVQHVFDSRTVAFADEIGALTDGKGVDLILNSLTGPFVHAGFDILADGGLFVEIGKNDVWSNERVAALHRNIRYSIVDLGPTIDQQPELIQSHLQKILYEFEAGRLRPLPVTIFEFERAPSAFRYMARAKHIGKVVLQHPTSLRIRTDLTYLVTGGLGALGLRTAERLAERGARSIVLVGRSPASGETAKLIETLRRKGVRVETRAADVAVRDQLAAVLSDIETSMSPLGGVIHAAGVTDDGVVAEQSSARMQYVMAPKVAGAWNLHELTAHLSLDFFILFSSMASLTGSPSQVSYAAGNAFLDGLAHYRWASGLPALSLNWGAWASSGMAAAVEAKGRRRVLPAIKPMDASECLNAFEAAFGLGRPQLAIVDAAWSEWTPALPLLATLSRRVVRPEVNGQEESILERLESAPVRNRRKILIDYLREQALRVLGLDSSHFIDERQPLIKIGFDSLMAVEFRNQLVAALERPLTATLLFDYPSLAALADFLEGKQSIQVEKRDAVLEDVETLSEEDAEELLKAELERS